MSASSAAHPDVPQSFICPITCEVMKDPVTAADGHSYEASAIMQWLASSNMSPLTGQPLPNKQLARSHALRNAIQEHEQAKATRREKERALRNVPPAPDGCGSVRTCCWGGSGESLAAGCEGALLVYSWSCSCTSLPRASALVGRVQYPDSRLRYRVRVYRGARRER